MKAQFPLTVFGLQNSKMHVMEIVKVHKGTLTLDCVGSSWEKIQTMEMAKLHKALGTWLGLLHVEDKNIHHIAGVHSQWVTVCVSVSLRYFTMSRQLYCCTKVHFIVSGKTCTLKRHWSHCYGMSLIDIARRWFDCVWIYLHHVYYHHDYDGWCVT